MDKQLKKKIEDAEAIKKLFEVYKEKFNLDTIGEYIKDNKIDFTYKDKTYRVRPLTSSEKEELYTIKNKKLAEYLQDENILSQEQLKKRYKEKEIADIADMEHKIEAYEKDLLNERLILGEALEQKKPEAILKTYKDKIELIKEQIEVLNMQIKDLYEMSLENQLELYHSRLLACLSTEVKDGDKWIKAFNSYEEFADSNEELIVKVLAFSIFVNHK